MADILIPYSPTGNAKKLVPFAFIAGSTTLALDLSGAASGSASYSTGASGSDVLTGDLDELHLKTNVANAFTLAGARFRRGSQDYLVKSDGTVQINPSPVTGNGTVVGSMTPAQGQVRLTAWDSGGSPEVSDWRGIAAAPINGADTPFTTYAITFRVPTAPLKTGSFSILGTMQDGTTFNLVADGNGLINGTRVKGKINYTTGVGTLVGVSPSGAAGQTQVDLSWLGISGVDDCYIDLIRQETLRFNAVAYTYLPINAALLGIDPTRLPTDGRVPIFKPGEPVVVGHAAMTTPATAVNEGTVDCGRTRLSRVRVIGNDGLTIHTGYSVDLENGIVTWDDVTGYSQPVRVEHRIEDLVLVRDVQIDGTLTFVQPLTHVFPVGSYVASALQFGDMQARTSLVFDQQSWDGTTFSDVLVGNAATGTYNETDHPITVSNAGAVTERWALQFTSTTAFRIVGEHLGVIGVGNINSDTSPINPVTGEPYFTIPELGWGVGWVNGNIVRINTVGSIAPVWVVQTIQQGPAGAGDYQFELLVRGGVDNPI